MLELRNGMLQYVQDDGRYSEVRFSRYDLSVASISQAIAGGSSMAERNSVDLISEALSTGFLSPEAGQRLLDRSAEALRVIAIGLFTLAIGAFPSGSRARIPMPIEAMVLLVAFAERGIGTYSPLGIGTGSVVLIIFSGLVLAWRLWPRRPVALVSA